MWHSGKAMSLAAIASAAATAILAAASPGAARANGWGGYTQAQVQQESARISYVVFHAVDRDGFCDAAAFGAVSLHPVLTDAPNDTMPNESTGLPNPRATLDVYIDSGDGVIVETNAGPVAGARSVSGLPTFSTYDNAQAGSPIQAFAPLEQGIPDECQAWVKVVSSLGQPANVLMIFHDDAGDIGFDRVVNAPRMASVTLSSRWSLVAWPGPDAVAPTDALSGTGAAKGGTNVASNVTAIYAWDAASSSWLAYFPGSGTVPGANTLTSLKAGQPYWIAIAGSTSLQWTVPAQ